LSTSLRNFAPKLRVNCKGNERLERRKLLPKGENQKQLDYFYDTKDADAGADRHI